MAYVLLLAIEYQPGRSRELDIMNDVHMTDSHIPENQRGKETKAHQVVGYDGIRFLTTKNAYENACTMDIKDIQYMPEASHEDRMAKIARVEIEVHGVKTNQANVVLVVLVR